MLVGIFDLDGDDFARRKHAPAADLNGAVDFGRIALGAAFRAAFGIGFVDDDIEALADLGFQLAC